MSLNRRDFARASALTALSYSRVLGSNDRVGLGVVGTGERGSYVMSLFQKEAEIEVRALCDVYAVKVDQALQKAPGAQTFSDHRRLLESSNSTPCSSAPPTTGTKGSPSTR